MRKNTGVNVIDNVDNQFHMQAVGPETARARSLSALTAIVLTTGLLATGCAKDLARASSAAIGCPPDSIEVSDVSVGWSQTSWKARCRQTDFYCAGEVTAQCSPDFVPEDSTRQPEGSAGPPVESASPPLRETPPDQSSDEPPRKEVAAETVTPPTSAEQEPTALEPSVEPSPAPAPATGQSDEPQD